MLEFKLSFFHEEKEEQITINVLYSPILGDKDINKLFTHWYINTNDISSESFTMYLINENKVEEAFSLI